MPRDRSPAVTGRVQVYTVEDVGRLLPGRPLGYSFFSDIHWTRRTPVGRPKHNDLLYEWGAIVGNLLLRNGVKYGIGGMYFEYENAVSPGDPVVAPVFSRDADQGVEYYNALGDSSDRDYLRVPLIAGRLEVSDAIQFPKGNEPTFFAQTTGGEGVHGKPFSSAVNSTVFGGALVAFVDPADPTQDLVLSRFYAEVGEQVVKLATTQIGYEWAIELQ